MKKVLLTAALVMVATSAFATNISTTKHNLSSGGTQSIKGANGEICKYCHTPHNAGATAPLWNRLAPTAITTKYTSTSMKATPATPTGTSLMCLSCHDSAPIAQTDTTLNITIADPNTVINDRAGNGMANDHPVSIVYNTTDPALKATPAVVKLFGTTMECASCHAVHDGSNPPFLRESNAGSALCLECHNK